MKFEDCFDSSVKWTPPDGSAEDLTIPVSVEIAILSKTTLRERNNLFLWFINREHVPLLEDYSVLYSEFLVELKELYLEKGHMYYIFSKDGKLQSLPKDEISEFWSRCYPEDFISINVDKIREWKLESILD